MNIIQYQYPFDPNGVLPSNLITNENHNITASAGLPYNFIIPRKAPYFADSLVVTHPASGRTLDVGVDYVHSYLFQQQSNTEPFLMVYGGISLLTTEYDGAVLTLQYQTLGGEYVLPEADILAILANAHIDPRMTSWDSVALRPGEYHPEAHLHHVSTTMGWDDLVLAVRDLIEKIRVESSELAALFQAHIDDKTNPHETDLIKLGIERFANVYKATLSQANLGTNDINYITPFLLRDVLNNTDLITADRVGLGLVENFPPATSTEILLGTIGRYVTSDLLKEFYARRNGEGATGLWDISILGNSATTSRLQTTRRINGTDFNGTANITTNEWGTTRNVTVGLTTRPVNGASNVSWSLADIGALPLTGGTTTGFVNLAGSAGVPLNISFLFNSQNTGLGWGIQETSADGFLRFQTREGTGSWTNRLVLSSDAVTSMNPITAPNFIGAVTGNASTATALQTARLINGTSFNGTANITTERWGTNRDITIGAATRSVNGSANVSWSLADIGAPSVTGTGAIGTWNIGISGNAATATILQTARTINGTSFNGSANITTANWGTARNITVGDTTKSVNGSANVSWSRTEMGVPRMTSSVSVGVENTESCVAYIANPLMGSPDGGLYSHVHSEPWKHQIQGDYRTGQIALRGKNNGTWQGWRFVLDSGNFNAYSPTLTGAGASGNWGINITGNAATATKAIGTTGQLTMRDIRTISPSAITAGHAQFGFTSWGNNNTTPYADFIMMRGYGDVSGGADNLVVFNKSTIGMRIYQQAFGSTNAFATYKDMAFTDGTNATGTWSISTSGNAATATALQTPRLINRKPFAGTANLDVSEWFHSGRDFPLGTLVTTNINYALADGEPWCLEVTGNPYHADNSESFETTAYGYIYNGTIINIGGQHNGAVMHGIIAVNVGGNLCFWWPRYAYWQGFNVRVYAATEANHNRVVSITNSADPGGTKRVTISDKLQDKPIRRGQTSTFVIPESGRSAGVTWTGLTDDHRIYAERYAGSQSTRLVIQNEDDDDDYTVFRHVLPSGSSPVDTFEVRRNVVRSNVFFEHVGMNRISDGTLKLNQSEVNYDDFDIDQLSLMNWTWSDDERVPAELRGKPGQGVIAQEVMKVFPDCVRESDEGILRVDDAMLATKLSIILLKKLKKLGL